MPVGRAGFDHERLEVYRMARKFKRGLAELFPRIPPGNADLKDQLKRAARSITSNIAEGSGKWQVRDKMHFYHIARGSAAECAADLDETVDYGFFDESQIRETYECLNRVGMMLNRIIQSLESREGPDMGSP